jgi:hypothetical protein
MRVCVPITADGQVDPRWGRADRVAVADVADGEIRDWQEFAVAWGTLHDQGTEGAHHARVARFLRDNQVQAIAAGPVCSACSARWRYGSSLVWAGTPAARRAQPVDQHLPASNRDVGRSPGTGVDTHSRARRRRARFIGGQFGVEQFRPRETFCSRW